jgi:lipoprotein-anchoring transpeptidase ErfK/SrfK
VTKWCRFPPLTVKLAEVPHLRLLLVAAPAVLMLAAGAVAARTPGFAGATARAAAHCRAGTKPLGSPSTAVVAVVRKPTRAYRRPGRAPFAHFGRVNVNRYPTTFRALGVVRRRDCRAAWYRVQLPIKPNGITGFVPARSVRLGTVHTRILVDLSARRLTLFRNGRRILRTVVAVGSPATPTPTGRYYVNQRLVPSDANGPFGPAALGVSAFSPVLTGWMQGGPIGIHGTNEPWSIGRAVSNGCIRLRNPVLRRVYALTPAGTPVVIRR